MENLNRPTSQNLCQAAHVTSAVVFPITVVPSQENVDLENRFLYMVWLVAKGGAHLPRTFFGGCSALVCQCRYPPFSCKYHLSSFFFSVLTPLLVKMVHFVTVALTIESWSVVLCNHGFQHTYHVGISNQIVKLHNEKNS